MASDTISSWQIEGEKVEAMTDFMSWAPKSMWTVTAAMKLRCFIFGRKAMTNLDSMLKNIDISLLMKVHVVKAMAFPVVMYGCESWTLKKAKHKRTDAFKLWWETLELQGD